MSEHTEGPWVADEWINDDAIYIKGAGGKVVAYLIYPDIMIAACGDAVRTRNNAHLIASAPEMAAEIERLKEQNAALLEACKLARSQFGKVGDAYGSAVLTLGDQYDLVLKLDEAIGRAKEMT